MQICNNDVLVSALLRHYKWSDAIFGTGTRVATLAWLAEHPDRHALLLTTPEALTQRIPPAERLTERTVLIEAGQELDLEWLRATLDAFGYDTVEQVDEPGEATLRPLTVDLWAAGSAVPVRLEIADDRVTTIRMFNPGDQLTVADAAAVRLLPASEGFTVPGEDGLAARRMLPDGTLWSLFDLMQDAAVAMIDGVDQRIDDWLGLVSDSYKVALTSVREGRAPPPPPDRLYLRREEVAAAFAAHEPAMFRLTGEPDPPPRSLADAARLAARLRDAGKAVVVCGNIPPQRLREMLARPLGVGIAEIISLENWRVPPTPGRIHVMRLPLRHGFELDDRVVLAVQSPRRGPRDPLEALTPTLTIGDLVVDPERGLAQLTGLITEAQSGAAFECLALDFRGGSRLLLPAIEAGRVWRYGAAGTVRPDRLDAATWQERREQTEREIETTAARLVARARERMARTAPVIEAADRYRRFARRVPFPLTADQMRAIREVQRDLAAGHPMLRLVCGDVGFGKTEIALHAAAIVAFAGHQVAIAAPTTLLARQHLNVFRRRLEGFGLQIGALIRSSRSKESRAVLHDLAAGRVDIVIGTHAVIGARFRDLALVVIDEEQRFGEAHKKALRDRSGGVHTLTMTATPLPRTLQSSLVDLLGLSLLSEPPAARLPVRGVVAPFDPVVVHAALTREARRGGQSFVVCPRIEDLEPIRARLREIVPSLSIVVAHGRMRGELLDRTVLDFASGDSDVLLTTNIVESGLDIPNANTMLIWRPERFGLAQLHQLRGRIGRAGASERVFPHRSRASAAAIGATAATGCGVPHASRRRFRTEFRRPRAAWRGRPVRGGPGRTPAADRNRTVSACSRRGDCANPGQAAAGAMDPRDRRRGQRARAGRFHTGAGDTAGNLSPTRPRGVD